MYEELIEELRRPHADCDPWALMDQAADAIEELSKPRWISVTERLPEGDNRILVCSKLRDGQYWQSVCRFANNLHEVDEYDFPNERRPGFYYYDDEYGCIEKTGVTRWMPLPEPPKEET